MALLCTFKRVKFLHESCIAFVKKENAAKKARRLHIPLLLFLLYLQTRWKTRAPGFPNCLLVPTLCDTSQHQRVDKSIEKQVHSRTQGSQLQLYLSLQLSSTAHKKEVKNN